jgi:predicted Zn-dependent protease
LAQTALGLLFLKYGRDAENQADELGFRYALNQNYDVREMDDVFATLSRISGQAGGGKLPEWLSTHPDPENRVGKTQARLDTLSRPLANTIVNQEEYLRRIQGIKYGEDPRQGYFEGNAFYHPDMQFQLTFPEGWQTQNTPSAVVGVSQNQDAIVQLGLAGETPPRQAAQQFLSQQGVQAGQSSTSDVNGNPAATSYFEAQTEQGPIQGIVSFISYGGRTFGLLTYTGQGGLQRYDGTFRQTISSFRQLRDQSKLNVRANRLELVKVPRQMTLQQFNQQYPSVIPIEELAIINQLEDASSVVQAGRTMKRVVKG